VAAPADRQTSDFGLLTSDHRLLTNAADGLAIKNPDLSTVRSVLCNGAAVKGIPELFS
jgi:hypothetical protein